MNMRHDPRSARAGGSTLLVALLTITTLSLAMGAFVSTVTNRSQVVYQSASWHEASLAAESAADLAVAEIRRVIPELVALPSDSWAGWTAALEVRSTLNGVTTITSQTTRTPVGKTIAEGVTLKLALPLIPGGEGSVRVDSPASLRAAVPQWLRLRAEGTSVVSGPARLSPEKLDNRLRRLVLLPAAGGRPRVSRKVEMILRPVMAFEAAVLTNGVIRADDTTSLVDSFDSTNTAKSTAGEYDSAKRQSAGAVQTNGATFGFAATFSGMWRQMGRLWRIPRASQVQ
jgi:hypothetical protein